MKEILSFKELKSKSLPHYGLGNLIDLLNRIGVDDEREIWYFDHGQLSQDVFINGLRGFEINWMEDGEKNKKNPLTGWGLFEVCSYIEDFYFNEVDGKGCKYEFSEYDPLDFNPIEMKFGDISIPDNCESLELAIKLYKEIDMPYIDSNYIKNKVRYLTLEINKTNDQLSNLLKKDKTLPASWANDICLPLMTLKEKSKNLLDNANSCYLAKRKSTDW